ncbi:MAG: DUF3601 domain-containing protein [Pelobium sp.]
METTLGLLRGQKYRVLKPFVDFDNVEHVAGETWIFMESHFLPYDDGLTVHVSIDNTPQVFRLQWRKEEQAGIIENFKEFVAPFI